MAISQNHIIQRQILEMELPDPETANEQQDHFSRLYHSKILPMMDQLCSRISPSTEVIRIDQLTIDIGQMDFNKEDELIRKIRAALEEELLAICIEARMGVTDIATHIKKKAGKIHSENGSQSADRSSDVLYYFLKTGSLPWWEVSPKTTRVDLFFELENASENRIKGLRPLANYSACRKRILFGLSEEKRKEFLLTWFPDAERLFNNAEFILNKILLKINSSKTTQNLWQVHLIEKIIALFNANPNRPFEKYQEEIFFFMVQKIWKKYPGSFIYFLEKIIAVFENNKTATGKEMTSAQYIFQEKIKITIRNSKKTMTDAHQERVLRYLIKSVFNPAEIISKGVLPDVATVEKQTEETRIKEKAFPETEIENWYIQNAGVVLCWPYLQYFFKGLELTEKNEFINEEAQWKAVHLLHFICGGESEIGEEEDLALFKILCGLNTADFVPEKWPLEENEKMEAEHLIKVMIENWKVLKKTSVRGFQTTFLQRPGILLQDQDGWLIKIERTSVDILLNKLTWPISVIRLPWVDKIIQVQW